MLKRLFLISLFILLFVSLSACEDKNEYVRLSGYTMGTTYQVTLKKNQIDTQKLQQQIDTRLQEINQLMSTYIDDSELVLFNKNRAVDCLPLSQETLKVIRGALLVSTETQGKFDVTLAPLIETWGFDKKETNNVIPEQSTIELMLNQIGFDKIRLESNCVAKANADLSINLSAIAKGYGVDEIARVVAAAGSQNYLVEIGGEIANKGLNPRNKPWRVAIESAATANRSIQRTLTPKGLGVATSGSYRNYFEKDGKRYSHTIDPTSGYPIDHTLAAVTVLHKETMMADAYSTAFMVMGPEATLIFANKKQLPVFMLVKDGDTFKEVYSDAYTSYLQ